MTTETIDQSTVGNLAEVMESKGFTGISFWDRPGNKATDPTAKFPLSQTQQERQTAFGHKLSALLMEGINSGDAGAFLTVSEAGTSVLVAATIPMDPLAVKVEGEAEPTSTNKWALNLNIAIPKEKKAATTTVAAEPRKALSLSDLRKFTAQNRAKK